MQDDGGRDRVHAWDELHAAQPAGWWVGSPSYHPERREWVMYAFDPSERAVVGLRQREWGGRGQSSASADCLAPGIRGQ